ncbi:MAG: DNA-3-methyladenine glycosylase 2 family protein [Candidatus Pacebacteria bacterium]|nr:DNA-3-methyladenine glycosylase 2 family protein [Candidatus Paceibacterota bacterium]
MSKKALNHFRKVDPALHQAAVKHKDALTPSERRPKDPFVSLCRSIVGQQLSGKAARAIWTRFIALFPKETPTPRKIMAMNDMQLRASGLSFGKIKALRALSETALKKKKLFANVHTLPDDTIREELVQIHGVGPWTVEMFLMFTLLREDVFSPGDLGLRKGIARLDKLEKTPTQKEAAERAERWQPHRTAASLILWAITDDADWFA